MLDFKEYRENVEKLREEICYLEDYIEYQRLRLRKQYYLENRETVNEKPSNLPIGSFTTCTTATIGISATTTSGSPSGFSKGALENIYDNDEEIVKARYKLKLAKEKLNFLRDNGYLPES